MRAASLCLLCLGLVALQATASVGKRQIGDPNCRIGPLEHQRVTRGASFHDPDYVSVKLGPQVEEPQVHFRHVKTVPKKYYNSKLYRVPRDVPVQPHEGDEVPPQLPLQLPREYGKQQQPPSLNHEDPQDQEDREEGVEQGADNRGKMIPATPLFVNARYQLRSRKVSQDPIILQQPVDLRLYQQLQQNGMILARPLNRAQLFQRIHGDNQNIDPGAESTMAVNEETCPDGEDPETEEEQSEGAQVGLVLASYNRTGLLPKPNSIQEVHKVTQSKHQNYGVNLSKENFYGHNLSVLPTPTRTAMSSLQQMHQSQQIPGIHHAKSQTGLYSQPTEGLQHLPAEKITKTREKKEVLT